MTVVITPVGTSLFTNGAKVNRTIKELSDYIKNERAYDWDYYSDYIGELKAESIDFICDEEQTASAELQSTSAIQGELGNEITVHLIASDTISSRLAAKILKEKLPCVLPDVDVEFNIAQDVIGGLCATKPTEFDSTGAANLLGRLNTIRDDNLQDGQELAINVTAGYAATVPLLTLFAQENQCPLYYNFEDTFQAVNILNYFP